MRMNQVAITFGSAYDYYETGGIPLTNSGMGLTAKPVAVIVLEDYLGTVAAHDAAPTSASVAGYMYTWDRSQNKLRMFFSATTAVNTELGLINLVAQTVELLVIGP